MSDERHERWAAMTPERHLELAEECRAHGAPTVTRDQWMAVAQLQATYAVAKLLIQIRDQGSGSVSHRG